jgi:protein-disulfide isomerase
MARSATLPRAAGVAALLVVVAACERGAARTADSADAKSATTSTTVAAAAPAWNGDTLLGRADAARIQGSPNATLWMVEISDFQCPYCKRWHEESYATIKREYVDTGRIRFAYLNLPLPNHKHAFHASSVAMCAGLQGRFWPLHDALFATQDAWYRADSATAAAQFDSLAARAGANAAEVRRCVNAGTVAPLVRADYERAVQSGVSSTPTFFIGSRVIQGAAPIAEFRSALDSALAAGAR